jgi:spoIIIJ-associated protein
VSETVTSQDQAEDQGGAEAGAETGRPPEDASRAERSSEDQLVREGDIAGDYLERLLDILDFDGDIDLDVEAGRAVVSVDGGKDLEKLVGARGDVLEALQELTRLAVQQSTGTRNRLMLDVAGWRSQRRSELTDLGRTAASEAKDTGHLQRLRPMTPFERKIVHDAVAGISGVRSESEGEEPRRRVVVHPTES